MKKCTYCGKEFPDEARECPHDGQPLALIPGAKPPPIPPNAQRATTAPLNGIAKFAIACAVALALLAFLAGLLAPAFAKARQKALHVHCAANLKQVGMALRIWSGNHGDALPGSLVEMSNELRNPNLLLCPADPNHARQDSIAPIWSSDNISYLYPRPQLSSASVQEHVQEIIVYCPIHHLAAMADGSVQQVSPTALQR